MTNNKNNRTVVTTTTTKSKPESFIQNRSRKWRERGGFTGKGPMQIIGTGLGGLYGPAGAIAGSVAGHAVGYLTGTGDYKHNGISSQVPGFNKNQDSIIITHREYVQDVVSGTGTPSIFNATVLPINPGVSLTFPWLSQIAENYDEYEMLGMVFQYVSTSGASVASTNTALGTVIMATQYDPTKPAFDTKQAMENYSFATSARPDTTFVHAVECKQSLTPTKSLYIRNGSVGTGDLRWTDFGNFTIATVGTPAPGITLGELWVTYKMKLRKPRIPSTIGGTQNVKVFLRSSVVTVDPLGTTMVSELGPLQAEITREKLTWRAPASTKWLVMVNTNSSTSAAACSVAAATGLTAYNLFANKTTNISSSSSGTVGSFAAAYEVTTANSYATVSVLFNSAVVVGTCTATIIIQQIDESVIV